jgi:ubiquinone/menaquinone biosynthesis C-methylase UbiE
MIILDAAFAHPRGPLGYLGGIIMGRSTSERNAWTRSLLNLRPENDVLDVGCGPGALIQALAAQVTSGIIAGVDLSPVMLRQAAKRNAKTLRAGRVRLQQGSALALPFADASFDTVLSANSVPFWPDQLAGVQEIGRVLKPGGEIALVLQPVWAKSDDQVRAIGAELLSLLTRAGFQSTRLEFKPMKPIASVSALGAR